MNGFAGQSHVAAAKPVGVQGARRDQGRGGTSVISDREFLGELEKYKDAFYRFVKRTTLSQSNVDDVFSSAVLSAYENRHKFTPGTNFRAWMYRILLNKCYVANRDTARTRQLPEAYEPEQPAPSQTVSWNTFHDLEDVLEACGDEVNLAILGLSFSQRVCLLLRVVEQLSYQEIAEVVEIPVGTVTTHLARARRKLRTELHEYARQQGLAAAMPH